MTLDLSWLEATMLAAVRMTAFIVIAPPFSYKAFPGRVKAMLGVGLGLAVAPRVTPGYESLATGQFVVALVLEVVVGAVLGFLVFLAFAAVQAAGSLIDLFGGFTLAQAFDPQSMVNGAQFTRLFQMTALALLFASGGHQLIIGGLTRSFTAFPLGLGLDLTHPVQVLTTLVSEMFLAAVQIAGPLCVVLFLADVGLGLLSRVAPALNAYALGFPLKILLTFVFVGGTVLALPGIVTALTGDAVDAVAGVR